MPSSFIQEQMHGNSDVWLGAGKMRQSPRLSQHLKILIQSRKEESENVQWDKRFLQFLML